MSGREKIAYNKWNRHRIYVWEDIVSSVYIIYTDLYMHVSRYYIYTHTHM